VDADGGVGDGLRAALEGEGRATLLGRRLREDKLEGVTPERVAELAPLADLVLVEADGARGRSLKVPAEHEPVVPAVTTLLIVVAALDVLGAPLDEQRVHRVERVLQATGGSARAVDEDTVAASLLWPAGYPARRPPGAALAAFLNKAEDEAALAAAARIAERLRPAYATVVAGSARAGTGTVWP
jgi:molybdenum cofactor cytidylyltransferase